MLSSISWQTYLYTLAFSMVAYYSFIVLVYYRYELSQLLFKGNDADSLQKKSTSILTNKVTGKERSRQTDDSSSNEKSPVAGQFNSETFSVESDEQAKHTLLVNLALQLEDELNVLFQDAAKKQYIKEELIMALQQQLTDYSPLKDSAFKPSVQNYIAVESKKQCSIHLDAEDLDMLWTK